MSCFVVLNSNGRIHTVSEKNDNVLSDGQILITNEVNIQQFIQSLPSDPHNCVYINGEFVENKLPLPLIYNNDTLISWALQQVFATELIPHMAAFLDFANKATVVSRDNFLAYATAVNMVDIANTIVAKAIELGANL